MPIFFLIREEKISKALFSISMVFLLLWFSLSSDYFKETQKNIEADEEHDIAGEKTFNLIGDRCLLDFYKKESDLRSFSLYGEKLFPHP